MPRLKHTLMAAYEEYEEYVLTALIYDDTEIDSFGVWGNRQYGLAPELCSQWEFQHV